MFSDVWGENAALFERLMEIQKIHQYHTMSLKLFYDVLLRNRRVYFCTKSMALVPFWFSDDKSSGRKGGKLSPQHNWVTHMEQKGIYGVGPKGI